MKTNKQLVRNLIADNVNPSTKLNNGPRLKNNAQNVKEKNHFAKMCFSKPKQKSDQSVNQTEDRGLGDTSRMGMISND